MHTVSVEEVVPGTICYGDFPFKEDSHKSKDRTALIVYVGPLGDAVALKITSTPADAGPPEWAMRVYLDASPRTEELCRLAAEGDDDDNVSYLYCSAIAPIALGDIRRIVTDADWDVINAVADELPWALAGTKWVPLVPDMVGALKELE